MRTFAVVWKRIEDAEMKVGRLMDLVDLVASNLVSLDLPLALINFMAV